MILLPPNAIRLMSPDLPAFVAAATESSDPVVAQYGPIAAIVAPIITTLIWYVKRSESNQEAALAHANARADRYEERLHDLHERTIPLLNTSAETNREVLRAVSEVMQAVRDLERGRRSP